MLHRTYPDQDCSIARALEVAGERWSLLVLRDVMFGTHRFDELQSSLGIARNVLAARLDLLTEEGLVERRRYQEHPERFEYHLTQAGRDLAPALFQLMKWGDRHRPSPDGAPVRTPHRGCGGEVDWRLVCDRCHQQVSFADLELVRRPGARSFHS